MVKLFSVIFILAGASILVYRYRDKIEEWFPGIKTKVWNGLVALVGLIGTLFTYLQENSGQFGAFMTPQNTALALIGIGVIGILLRSVTK